VVMSQEPCQAQEQTETLVVLLFRD